MKKEKQFKDYIGWIILAMIAAMLVGTLTSPYWNPPQWEEEWECIEWKLANYSEEYIFDYDSLIPSIIDECRIRRQIE